MGVIHRLAPSVVNQIAAGEVVERPASVVKELLENAIDAQATRIEVSVERGGKDLIRVADDGVGMSEEDLPLAFQAHATSKLATAEDLTRVQTLGFRGEALAAIAEISKTRCQTRQSGAPEGSELVIEWGAAAAVKPCGGPPGTVIEVRNLFYNTPVRRTFLKSDATESGHVVETFSRIALARPEIHMTFRSGGKILYDLPVVAGTRERIAIFFGRELAESLIWVESRFERMHLWGYVGHPSQSRSTAKGQFLFLGGRYVRDRSLGHALNEAYRGLLMVGRMPVAFIHLDLPPDEVDVNVHPTKVEVRFRDAQRIYSHLLSTLRQTFLKSDLHSRLQPEVEGKSDGPGANDDRAPSPRERALDEVRGPDRGRFGLSGSADDRQAVAGWFAPAPESSRIPDSVGRPVAPAWSLSLPLTAPDGPGDQFNEFQTPTEAPRSGDASPPRIPPSATADPFPINPFEGETSPRSPLQVVHKAIQVHDSYLIVETSEGMMVVDQHALHERILYEELRARIARGAVESQRLLEPEPVDLPPAEAALLIEQADLLQKLGVEVESFGGGTILVRGMPAMLRGLAPERLVRDLAEHLRNHPLPPTRDALLAELLHMVACKGAVKAGDPLKPAEINALLERGDLTADSHHCPHGRPTALVFTKDQLEKQFGRI